MCFNDELFSTNHNIYTVYNIPTVRDLFNDSSFVHTMMADIFRGLHTLVILHKILQTNPFLFD